MDDHEYLGRVVYLTGAIDAWVRRINTKFNVPMACRLAKVIKVFDWTTEEGKFLLETRKKSGKWERQDPEDFKFVLKVYYPDLTIKNTKGFTADEVLPRCLPGTDKTMFEILPEWVLYDFARKDSFDIKAKEITTSEEIKEEKLPKKPPEWLKNYIKNKAEAECTSMSSPKKRARQSGNTKSQKST